MEPAAKNVRRPPKRLSRTEKVVIFGLIILASANAELGITDNASLDAFEQNLQDAPHKFVWPLVLFAGAGGFGFLWWHLKSSFLKTALSYATIITFAVGLVRLTTLITP